MSLRKILVLEVRSYEWSRKCEKIATVNYYFSRGGPWEMTKRTVVIRKKSFCWQPNIKRKTQKTTQSGKSVAGFINPVFIVLACTVFSGVFYVYSINQTATKGIAIGQAEKEIAKKKNENDSLRIREAEVKSLYHIEDQSKNMNMVSSQNVIYLEESPAVAYSDSQAKNKK